MKSRMSHPLPPLVPTRHARIEMATHNSVDVFSGAYQVPTVQPTREAEGALPFSQATDHRRGSEPAKGSEPARGQTAGELISVVSTERWFEKLQRVSRTAENWEACLRGVAGVIQQDPNCNAIWLASFQNPATDPASQIIDPQHPPTSINSDATPFKIRALTDDAPGVWQVVERTVQQMLKEINADQQGRQVQLHQPIPQHLIAIPCELTEESASNPSAPRQLILIVCFDQCQQMEHRNWLAGMAVRAITDWKNFQNWQQLQNQRSKWTETLSLNSELDRSTNHVDAARILVNRIRLTFELEQVAITIAGKLVAVSDLEVVDRQNEASRTMERACHQSCVTGTSISFSQEEGLKSADQLPLQAFCQMRGMPSCLSIPICTRRGDHSPGDRLLVAETAVLMIGDHQRITDPKFVERATEIGARIGDHLNLVLTSHQSLAQRGMLELARLMQHRWRKAIAVGILLLMMLMAMPLPYRIGCECEMQPVLRRFVNAPFDSVLEKTMVKNGDLVSQDQILARLDGRLIRMELAGLEAELAGAKKRHDQELAIGNVAASQIAKSEMERLKAKIGLLQDRTNQLEIRAPLEGIVINGDLEKVEGAPLTVGQSLFEIAPLREMIAEVAIPESEALYAQAGMPVALKLNTYPFRTWEGTVESIHPSSEIIDGQSVFIAEVRLENHEDLIRPGMKGRAKIQSQWKPLGWNLFHRSWEHLRYWLIW